MKQREEKQVFIKTLQKELKNREALRQFFNTTFKDILRRFDGKVYNKRFDTALNEALKAVSPMMYAKCDIKNRNRYSNFPDNNLLEVVLYVRNSEHNYNDTEAFYTNVVLSSDLNYNLRIDADKSQMEKYTAVWAENFDKETETRKEIIKNYNKLMKISEQMEKAVKAYNDLPHRFRQNIDLCYLRIY